MSRTRPKWVEVVLFAVALVLLAMSSDTRATKEYLQPQVDRARAWLALRKGAKR